MATFHPKPDVILTELQDGTAVLLNLHTKFYFTLGKTSLVVWKTLDGGASVEALGRALSERFAVDETTAEHDAAELLEEMLAEGLITRVS